MRSYAAKNSHFRPNATILETTKGLTACTDYFSSPSSHKTQLHFLEQRRPLLADDDFHFTSLLQDNLASAAQKPKKNETVNLLPEENREEKSQVASPGK